MHNPGSARSGGLADQRPPGTVDWQRQKQWHSEKGPEGP